MDEGLSKAVVKVFVELYRAGLIYKDKRLVNWDPKLGTAISDLEVQQVEVRGQLWHIRYPLAGASFDPNDASTFITVATTRPETMLGDVAVAVHPDGKLYLALNQEFRAGVPASADMAETLKLSGFDRFAARKKIVERLEAAGLIEKIEPHTHMVPHGDRSGEVIEPFLTDQWYVD